MKKTVLIATSIAVITTIWIGSGFLTAEEPVQKTKKDTKQEQIIQVRTANMQAQEYVSEVILTGRTEAIRIANVGAEVAGSVKETPVKEGQSVVKGDVLVFLDTNDKKAVYQKATQALKQAEIEYNAAKTLTKKGYNSEIRLATSRAKLESAKADLVKAKIDLGNLEVKAPFDGVLETRHIDVGDYLNIGDPVVTIVDLNPIKITGFVSEKQIADIGEGSETEITLLDGRKITGMVTFLSAKADEQTRTFRIEVEIPNEENKIVAGLTADMKVKGQSQQAYFISSSYLSLADDGVVGVKTVDDQNVVHFHPVTILSDKANGMWVSGLPETAQIITLGHEFVVEGQSVEAVNAEITLRP